MRPRELGVARVAQHLRRRPDHDRRLLRSHAELAQQRLRLPGPPRVDPAVRQPVAGRELAQPPRVRRVARADDPEAGAEPDQQRAPEQVGAQDEVAERRVVRRQLAQPLDRHGEHLARLDDHRREERGLAGEQAELAEEAARTVHARARASGRRRRRPPPCPRGRRRSRSPVALAEQHVAGLGAAPLAVARQRFDLPLAQPRERAVAVRRLRRRLRRGRRVHLPSVGRTPGVASGWRGWTPAYLHRRCHPRSRRRAARARRSGNSPKNGARRPSSSRPRGRRRGRSARRPRRRRSACRRTAPQPRSQHQRIVSPSLVKRKRCPSSRQRSIRVPAYARRRAP